MSDAAFFLVIFLTILLFVGEPDLHDVIIERVSVSNTECDSQK